MTSPTLQTSWAFFCTRWASSRTLTSTSTTSTASLLRVFATLNRPSSQAETVNQPLLTAKQANANRFSGKQKITDQIAQLKYKEPNSPRIVILEQELVRAEAESLVAEAQLSNITREKLKAAFSYQFNALREHSEKMAIIAGYGKHLLELIDDTPVTPGETRSAYDGYEASKAIIQDCEDTLTNWVDSKASVNAKLSTRARNLSQRRRNLIARNAEGGHDLSAQDAPYKDRESGQWVPASTHADEYDDEDELDDRHSLQDSEIHAGETRGRAHENHVLEA